MDEIFVRVADDNLVCVPHDLRHLTSYVLLEQEDWFEREIGFIRRYLSPGMRALDVGASYGTYGLAMARAVGPTGRVWCFEPGSTTRKMLERSVVRNGLTQISVIGAAVARDVGRAYLHLQDNSEFNRLSAQRGSDAEEVVVTTLDRQQEIEHWGDIDFVKLDVEGEELNVLLGGARFFAEQTPLVMFELKHGDKLNLDLLSAFGDRGYDVFSLTGPDQFLAPFDPTPPIDVLALNLFACKPARAAALADRGLLTWRPAHAPRPTVTSGRALIACQAFASIFDLTATPRSPDSLSYHEALADYAAWRDPRRPLAERFALLERAVATLRVLVDRAPAFAYVASLARIAGEAGQRSVAAIAAGRLVGTAACGPFNLEEPFWPPSARFDDTAPGSFAAAWATAAAIEQHERQRAFSSYFTPDSLEAIEWVQSTPFGSAEFERRRQLIRLKAGLQKAPEPTPLLDRYGPESRNPEFWAGAPIIEARA
jgi:FkbM family methyltransferase